MAITLLRLPPAPETKPAIDPAADLRQLHRMALAEMARFEEEMERLGMPDEAIDKYRDAVLLAFEDYRRRHRSDQVLAAVARSPVRAAPLDTAPAPTPALRRFLGF